jgi:nucleotide-binding universal stress UspA family protein/predicted transcriptional regulator
MAAPYRKIMCPVDFDDSSLEALDAAARIARDNDGTLIVLHIVPMVIMPTGMPVYVDVYKGQEDVARRKLIEIARTRLAGIKYELMVKMGIPAESILQVERKLSPDLLVMATHGRKGFSHFFLGSVAEVVLRQATCPVMTIRAGQNRRSMVAGWMTVNPVTAAPTDKLSTVRAKMAEGEFRCVPVLDNGKLVGMVTDRDLRQHAGVLETTEVAKVMTTELITVTPASPLKEAARLMRERKIGGLPVLEGDALAGVITTADVLRAFCEAE